MDLKQLEYYVIAYESGSFLGAASSSFITQQGISRSISNLELELGTPLFHRSRQGLTPTAAGEKLYQFALAYIRDLNNMKAEIKGEKNDSILRIGFDIGFMELIPFDLFSELYLTHPDDTIHISNYVDECKSALLKGDVDLGFCSLPVDAALFDTIVEVTRKVQLAVSDLNPLASRETIRVAELKGQNLIDIELHTPAQMYYRNICKLNGIEPNIRLNASQGKFIDELVSKNVAVSFYAGEEKWLPPKTRLISFEDIDVSFGFQLLARKGTEYTKLMLDFINLLQNKLKSK